MHSSNLLRLVWCVITSGVTLTGASDGIPTTGSSSPPILLRTTLPLYAIDHVASTPFGIVALAGLLFLATELSRIFVTLLLKKNKKIVSKVLPNEFDIPSNGWKLVTNLSNIVWLFFDVVVTLVPLVACWNRSTSNYYFSNYDHLRNNAYGIYNSDSVILNAPNESFIYSYNRFFTKIPGISTFGVFKLAFELLALVEDYNNDYLFIIHHVLAGTAAFLVALGNLHVHVLFFMGTASLSSCFLVTVDTFRRIPKLSERFPKMNNFFIRCFVSTFLVLRVGLWSFFSVYFWYDSLHLFYYKVLTNNRKVVVVAIIFLLVNLVMTMLQFAWASKIIKLSRKTMMQDKADSETEDHTSSSCSSSGTTDEAVINKKVK
eukprot:Filipodium_phascolosomae@DN609_c0_g1_i1.p1